MIRQRSTADVARAAQVGDPVLGIVTNFDRNGNRSKRKTYEGRVVKKGPANITVGYTTGKRQDVFRVESGATVEGNMHLSTPSREDEVEAYRLCAARARELEQRILAFNSDLGHAPIEVVEQIAASLGEINKALAAWRPCDDPSAKPVDGCGPPFAVPARVNVEGLFLLQDVAEDERHPGALGGCADCSDQVHGFCSNAPVHRWRPGSEEWDYWAACANPKCPRSTGAGYSSMDPTAGDRHPWVLEDQYL